MHAHGTLARAHKGLPAFPPLRRGRGMGEPAGPPPCGYALGKPPTAAPHLGVRARAEQEAYLVDPVSSICLS